VASGDFIFPTPLKFLFLYDTISVIKTKQEYTILDMTTITPITAVNTDLGEPTVWPSPNIDAINYILMAETELIIGKDKDDYFNEAFALWLNSLSPQEKEEYEKLAQESRKCFAAYESDDITPQEVKACDDMDAAINDFYTAHGSKICLLCAHCNYPKTILEGPSICIENDRFRCIRPFSRACSNFAYIFQDKKAPSIHDQVRESVLDKTYLYHYYILLTKKGIDLKDDTFFILSKSLRPLKKMYAERAAHNFIDSQFESYTALHSAVSRWTKEHPNFTPTKDSPIHKYFTSPQ
jgi:hypothetical protein